jgi:hypothetical protein
MANVIQLNTTNPFVMQLIAQPMLAVVMHYASCLLASAKALAFVTDELGLTPEQATAQQIGFSDRSLGTHVPSKQIKIGREIRESLVPLGVYKANGRETLRGYVTVPIRDEQGTVIGIRGHKVDKHAAGDAVVEIGERREVLTTEGTEATKDDLQTAAPEAISRHALASGSLRSHVAPTVASASGSSNPITIQDGQISFQCSDRQYRIRGLEKNTSTTMLRINLLVSRDSLVHLDSLDLVKARSRTSFIKAAASELFVDEDIIKKDIGRLLLQLETLQSEQIDALKQPKTMTVKLTADEEREALSLLRDPHLLQRIVADFEACGIVGESTGKLAGYLAATSRKLSHPLAIVIQSSSSAGKTSLMDAVLAMMPPEDVQRFSGMTGRSLFYLDSDSIRHKILAISEDEGASEASYALKLLQSDGELRHATVGRGENGKVETQSHHVEGPVQIFLTTTAMQVDEELVNRCLVLSVDETSHQTQAILSRQRDACTLDVMQTDFVRDSIRKLHQNAQRLLVPLHVFNPFAPQLTFPSHKTRMRRDHAKYLTLIDTIAFLHQHQRTVHELPSSSLASQASNLRYINVEKNDIAVANGIAGEVLGRSLDELSPQTRSLLNQLHTFVHSQSKLANVPRDSFRFTRRDLREAIHWSDSQVRTHLDRLVELEYVLVHRGRGGQRYIYELLYNGEGAEDQPFLMGLIDPAKLKHPSSIATYTPMPKTLTPLAATLTP